MQYLLFQTRIRVECYIREVLIKYLVEETTL
jgi:hypothetical protein